MQRRGRPGQQGERGGRGCGVGRAARRHVRVTSEMLQQLLGRGESLAAVCGVARDPVAHVGQLRAGGQRGKLRVRVNRAQGAIGRNAAGFVITLSAPGRTGTRRHARARRQFAIGDVGHRRRRGRRGARQ